MASSLKTLTKFTAIVSLLWSEGANCQRFGSEAQYILIGNTTGNVSSASSADSALTRVGRSLAAQQCNGGCDYINLANATSSNSPYLCADDGSNVGLTFYCANALACFNEHFRTHNGLAAFTARCMNRACPCDVTTNNTTSASNQTASITTTNSDEDAPPQVIIGAGIVTIISGNRTITVPIKRSGQTDVVGSTTTITGSQRMARILPPNQALADQCNSLCSSTTQANDTSGAVCVDDSSTTSSSLSSSSSALLLATTAPGRTLNCLSAFDCFNSSRTAAGGSASLLCFGQCPCDFTQYAWWNETVQRLSSTTAAPVAVVADDTTTPATPTTTGRLLPQLPIVERLITTASTESPSSTTAITTDTTLNVSTTSALPTSPPSETDLNVVIVGSNNQTFGPFETPVPSPQTTASIINDTETFTPTFITVPTPSPSSSSTATESTPTSISSTETTTTTATSNSTVNSTLLETAFVAPSTTPLPESPTIPNDQTPSPTSNLTSPPLSTSVVISTSNGDNTTTVSNLGILMPPASSSTIAPVTETAAPPANNSNQTTIVVSPNSSTTVYVLQPLTSNGTNGEGTSSSASATTTTIVVSRTNTTNTSAAAAASAAPPPDLTTTENSTPSSAPPIRVIVNSNSSGTDFVLTPASGSTNSNRTFVLQPVPSSAALLPQSASSNNNIPQADTLPSRSPMASRSVIPSLPGTRRMIDLSALIRQQSLIHSGNPSAVAAALSRVPADTPSARNVELQLPPAQTNDSNVMQFSALPDLGVASEEITTSTTAQTAAPAAAVLNLFSSGASSTPSTVAPIPPTSRMSGDASSLDATVAAAINNQKNAFLQTNVVDGSVPTNDDESSRRPRTNSSNDASPNAAKNSNSLDAEDLKQKPLQIVIVLGNSTAAPASG